MTTHKAIRDALPELPEPDLYAHELIENGGGVWVGTQEAGICEKAYVPGETGEEVRSYCTADQMREQITARQEAQRQLYEARERHTAEVKKLQAEIGRLQALRREPMTEQCLIKALVAQALFFKEGAHTVTSLENDIRATLAHHHITQKEQG